MSIFQLIKWICPDHFHEFIFTFIKLWMFFNMIGLVGAADILYFGVGAAGGGASAHCDVVKGMLKNKNIILYLIYLQ